MKSANEVLASMKPDESLVDNYLSVIEKLVDEAAQNGKYSESITLNFIEQVAVNAKFLRKTIPEKLTSLGYTVSNVCNGLFCTTLTVAWGSTQSEADQKKSSDAAFLDSWFDLVLGSPDGRRTFTSC